MHYAEQYAMSLSWGSGSAGDVPVRGDYDGDGMTDITVWRASTGRWYILQSSLGLNPALARAIHWGAALEGDVPVAGDYDGDGRTDIAVWRGPTGFWFIRHSSTGYGTSGAVKWGTVTLGDVPISSR
jgi:hypothetical protein